MSQSLTYAVAQSCLVLSLCCNICRPSRNRIGAKEKAGQPPISPRRRQNGCVTMRTAAGSDTHPASVQTMFNGFSNGMGRERCLVTSWFGAKREESATWIEKHAFNFFAGAGGVPRSFAKTELETEKIDGKTIQETIDNKLIALGTKGRISTKWLEQTYQASWEEVGRHHGGVVLRPCPGDPRRLVRCTGNNEPRRQQDTAEIQSAVFVVKKLEWKVKDMLFFFFKKKKHVFNVQRMFQNQLTSSL